MRGHYLLSTPIKRAALALSLALLTLTPLAAHGTVTKGGDNDTLLSPESLCAPAGSADGLNQLESMLERVRGMKGYCFDSVLTTYKNGKPITEIGKLYFKSPNMVRFEVIKSGSHNGAIVVRQPNGKIRGQMGGLLSGIKLTLSPDSALLKSANGFSCLQSDLESLLSGAERKAKANAKCLAAAPAAGRPALVEILESDGDVSDRIAVDDHAHVPAQWTIFNSNKLLSVLRVNNLTARNDLTNDMFTLGTDDAVKSLGDEDESDAGDGASGALKGLGGKDSLTEDACTEIGNLVKAINSNVDALPKTVTDADGKWNRKARESVLVTCVRLEALLDFLNPVGPALKNTAESEDADKKSTALGITSDWNRSISESRAAIAALFDEITIDQADSVAAEKRCAELKSTTDQLQVLSRKISELI